jgi:hypothetical protein
MKKSQPKAQPQQPVKKIGIKEAFLMWMKGTGRSELADQTGLTRGELRKAFKKHSGKSWKDLQVESGRKKDKKANKEGLRRKAA